MPKAIRPARLANRSPGSRTMGSASAIPDAVAARELVSLLRAHGFSLFLSAIEAIAEGGHGMRPIGRRRLARKMGISEVRAKELLCSARRLLNGEIPWPT
jgi:hypothetical protein